jgi:hypothetical protein
MARDYIPLVRRSVSLRRSYKQNSRFVQARCLLLTATQLKNYAELR